MKNKLLSIVIIGIILLISSYPALAVTSSEYRQQSQQVEDKKEDAEKELDEVNAQINATLQEVENLKTSIDSVQVEIEELSDKVDSLNNSIEIKERDLAEKQKLLEERLVISYMNGDNTYLDALLSGGFLNFITNYETIKQIAEYDTNLMNEVEKSKNELEDKKTEVENTKNAKEEKSKELTTLKANKTAKVNSLSEEQKQIQSQIDEYDEQMKVLARKEKEQAAKEEAARKAAERKKQNTTTSSGSSSSGSSSSSGTSSSGSTSSGTTSSGSSTGQFLWPVPASHYISSGYGYRIHPISHTKKLHAGIDIAAGSGSNIVAAESGTVLLASYGYNGGYGNYVIISHGNGVTTRYAHCKSLSVSTGDTVSRGQVIAGVGTTGSSTGNHCHFEVRINGESKNPNAYL